MTNESGMCVCGWYQDDRPSDEAVDIHDEFVAMDGPNGMRHLNRAIYLAAEFTDPSEVEGFVELAGRHNFADPAGVYELATTLDDLIRVKREMDKLYELRQ